MDNTLRYYLNLAEDINTSLEKNGCIMSSNKIEERILTIQAGIKNIQSIAKRMADISNMANQFLLHRNKKISDEKCIDPYPTQNDHATMRIMYKDEKKNIVDDISLPVKTVENASDIPLSKIYYINSLKQYAINIEGVIIKGNIGNIMNYREKYTARCEYGIKCKNFSNKKPCEYYHEPEDYISVGIEVPDDNIRNYTTGSWIYSTNKNPHAYYTRHIGSRDSLGYDLKMLNKIQYHEEIANREGQIIHDLLIYFILHESNYLEKYKHWKKL